MSAKEMRRLEVLNLVARVGQELFNHMKIEDKSMAEFVIAVSRLLESVATRLTNARRCTLRTPSSRNSVLP